MKYHLWLTVQIFRSINDEDMRCKQYFMGALSVTFSTVHIQNGRLSQVSLVRTSVEQTFANNVFLRDFKMPPHIPLYPFMLSFSLVS